jgi:hypothetical protein
LVKLIRWKVIAVAGIVAMAVSLTSGGISGVRLGTLILRALVGGFLFAAFAAGVNLLIARVFPEILESGYVPAAETGGGDETEHRVDIVVPEENPHRSGIADELDNGDSDVDGELETAAPVAPLDEDGTVNPDALPDLDRFADAFEGRRDDGGDVGEIPPAKSDVPGGDKDPGELAQAIHTVLARDEKG